MKKLFAIILTATLMTLQLAASAETIYENIKREQITKGVLYEEIDTYKTDGWQRTSVVKIDLKDEDLEVKVLSPAKGSSSLATVKQMAETHSTKAAVNGDFFNFSSGETNMLGMMVSGGEMISTPAKDGLASFALTEDNSAIFDYFTFSGTLYAENTSLTELSSVELYQINKMPLTTGAITMITSAWGDTVNIPIGNYAMICEPYEENKYKMIGFSWGAEPVAIPDGGAVFTANYEINGFLNLNFAIGDVIRVETTLSPDVPAIKESIGGNTLIVKNGTVCNFTNNISGKNPRTALGVSADGNTLYFVAVQGRITDCPGMTQEGLAQFMIALGCDAAINLDGGGSTTMVTENRFTGAQEVKNDITSLRQVSNAIGVISHLAPLEVAAVGEIQLSSNTVVCEGNVDVWYVFRDQNYNRITGPNVLIQTSDSQAVISGNNIVFKTPGNHTVSVTYQNIVAETQVRVLGDIFSISISPEKVSATDKNQTFLVTAYDRNGHSAPIPASLVTFSHSDALSMSGNTLNKTATTGTVTASYKNLTANAVVNGETYLRSNDIMSEDHFYGTIPGGQKITVAATASAPQKFIGLLQIKKYLQTLQNAGDIYAPSQLFDNWNLVENCIVANHYSERTIENSKIVTLSIKNASSIRLTDSTAWSKIKNLCQSATEKNIVFILDTNITKLDANEKTVWNYYMNMLTERGKNVFVVSPGIKTSAEPSGGVFYLFLGAPGQSSVNSVFYDLNQAKPLRFTFLGDEIKYTFQS